MIHVELVNDDFGINPGHLIWAPSKHIYILYKKQQRFNPILISHTYPYLKIPVNVW